MTRLELYHNKSRQFQWKLVFLIILLSILIISLGYMAYQYYSQTSIQISSSKESQGKKIVVSLPNGHEVFTYEKYIVKKGGKTYYQGERNTIDLTGGKVEYKDW